MPKIRPGMKRPPPGFEKIAEGLDAFDDEMKAAINEPHKGKRKVEATWAVADVSRRRTRFVFDKFQSKEISQQVFDYCCENRFIDAALAKKWRLSGYERLCCLQCVFPKNHAFEGSCICRVPKKDRRVEDIECATCGCTGCASGDIAAKRREMEEGEKKKKSKEELEEQPTE